MTKPTGSRPAGSAEAAGEQAFVIGVVSDTHDHLYPEVKRLLTGVDHIVHAGDVCSASVLTSLRALAPVTVVRGNCDTGAWANDLPSRTEVELGGVRFLVGHIGGRLKEEVERNGSNREGLLVVIFGHSHQPQIEERGGTLFVNPGSAGPRRWGRPRTMALIRIVPEPSEGGTSPGDGAHNRGRRVDAEIAVLES